MPPLQIDSQAKYAELVRGNGGVFFRVRLPRNEVYDEKIWDHAPGSLLVTESGGEITNLEGEIITFSSGRTFASLGIFASHTLDHSRVLQGVRDAKEMQEGEEEGDVGEEIDLGQRTEEQKEIAASALGMQQQVKARAEWEAKNKQ